MAEFVTYKEDDKYFILQKEFPHFVCQISEQPIVNFIQPLPISNYNLWIIFYATLRGNMIPSYKDIHKEIVSVMNAMAIWYYEQRILQNEKKYKKWKIQ